MTDTSTLPDAGPPSAMTTSHAADSATPTVAMDCTNPSRGHQRLLGGSMRADAADGAVDGPLETARELARLERGGEQRPQPRAGAAHGSAQRVAQRLNGGGERATLAPAEEVALGIGDVRLTPGGAVQERRQAAGGAGASGPGTGTRCGFRLTSETGLIERTEHGLGGGLDRRRPVRRLHVRGRGTVRVNARSRRQLPAGRHGRRGDAPSHDRLRHHALREPAQEVSDVRVRCRAIATARRRTREQDWHARHVRIDARQHEIVFDVLADASRVDGLQPVGLVDNHHLARQPRQPRSEEVVGEHRIVILLGIGDPGHGVRPVAGSPRLERGDPSRANPCRAGPGSRLVRAPAPRALGRP